MKGFGTVVTGTLIAGVVRREQELQLHPSGKVARARGVQVHGAATEEAHAGERTAVNLAGVPTETLARGMMLTQPGTLEPTRQIDVRLELLPGAKPLRHLARVHLHCFASETVAQVRLLEGKEMKPGSAMLAQLRPEQPLLVVPGDRFIIRQFSPVLTIGGGVVLDSFPMRRSTKQIESARALLTKLEQADAIEALALRIERRGSNGLRRDEAVKETGRPRADINSDAQKLLDAGRILAAGDLLLAKGAALEAAKKLLAGIEVFHKGNPLVAGIAKETLREKLELSESVFSFLLAQLAAGKKIEVQGEQVRLAGRGVTMNADEQRARKTIEQAFLSTGLKVPSA